MENLLLWNQDGKHYCEFTIDKLIVDKYNLKEGDEIDLIKFFEEINVLTLLN